MVGEMRHRLQFYRPIKGRNQNTGEQKNTWVQHVELWGKYDFLKSGSGEDELGGRDGYERNILLNIRYRSDLTNEMYVKITSLNLECEIESILPDLTKFYTTIEARQVKPNETQAISTAEGNEWIEPEKSFIDAEGNFWQTGDGENWLITSENTWQFTGDGPAGN